MNRKIILLPMKEKKGIIKLMWLYDEILLLIVETGIDKRYGQRIGT